MRLTAVLLCILFIAITIQAQQNSVTRLHFLESKEKQEDVHPNLAGMWNLRILNSKNMPNGQIEPTQFTFDIVPQKTDGSVQSLSNTGFEDYEFTSSVCVASGGGDHVNVSADSKGSVSFQVFVDNGESYSMTGVLSSDGTTVEGVGAQYVGKSGCGSADNGSAFVAMQYRPATGTYDGSFTSAPDEAPFAVRIQLKEDTNFNLTGTIRSSGNACFAGLEVNSDVYASLVSGNVAEFYGTDSNGDVIGFIANTGGPNDLPEDLDWHDFYITGVSYGGPCTGQSFSGAHFRKECPEMAEPQKDHPDDKGSSGQGYKAGNRP